MNMQFEGPYTIKSNDGKKKIFVYPADMDQGLTPAEQDKQALRFEIVSLEPNKLVLIPPVYEFNVDCLCPGQVIEGAPTKRLLSSQLVKF